MLIRELVYGLKHDQLTQSRGFEEDFGIFLQGRKLVNLLNANFLADFLWENYD